MIETQWDIEEIKRLKMKLLIQYNFFSILLFVLLVFFALNAEISQLVVGIYVFMWILVAYMLYNLIAEKPIATKASRIVQEFDRNQMGEERWKLKKWIEFIICIVICIFITNFVTVNDFNSINMDSFLPFIGAWAGYNIGEIYRIRNL